MKQRLIGAAVLVALAVIFLPMLVQGPAPDSGVSDLPLQMPEQPGGEYETRDLPLVTPGADSTGAVLGGDGALPTVDTATAPRDASEAPVATAPSGGSAASARLPATAAGGNYAVSFGVYGNSANADTVVTRLRASGLPGRREQAMLGGKAVWRVRIGPYATRAEAEAARIAAQQVRDNADARVIALDAESSASANPVAPAASTPAGAKPAASSPAATKPAATEAPKPAAADAGFAVQLGAFSKPGEASALRDRARAAGMTAFTDTVQTDRGTLTRVKVGPVLRRADADALRAQAKARLGIDGIVRPHP